MLSFILTCVGIILFFIGILLLLGSGWALIILSYLGALVGYYPLSEKTKVSHKHFNGLHSLLGKLSAVLFIIFGIAIFLYGASL